MKNNLKLKNNKKMKTQITKTLMAIALLAAGFVANANENERNQIDNCQTKSSCTTNAKHSRN